MTNQTPPRAYDRTSYVLIVDDDNTLLKFFKIHLNKFFSRIVAAKSAKEALTMLREKDIDVVLTDVRMPRMDGLSFMAKVRAYDPTIPVMIISGALDEEQELFVQGEADGLLRKPFSVDELHQFIDMAMDRREKLRRLGELCGDKAVVRKIRKAKAIKGKALAAKDRAEAEALLAECLKTVDLQQKAG